MKLITILLLFIIYKTTLGNSYWWENASIYDIVVWSFKDTNDDGIGDLKGVTSKLDYLKNLGISAIKLSPIFSSPDEITDSYAVDNFYAIHSTIGTMDDFYELVKEANNRDIKVILDINLNHCHITHEWFQKSIKKISPYADYFVWSFERQSGRTDLKKAPNGWKNSLSKNAWNWNNERNQFYYNHYNSFSPDFNLRNEEVQKEILDMLKFWINNGVSGFNLLNIKSYLEDENPMRYYTQNIDYDETLKFIRKLKYYFDYEFNFTNEKILMTKISNAEFDNFYDLRKAFHLITVGKLSEFDIRNTKPAEFFKYGIQNLISSAQSRTKLEWLLESSDSSRIQNGNNKELAEVLLLFQSLLPGSMRIYYGSELGMTEYFNQPRKCINMKWNYRNSRTLPMQWDGTLNAGFSSSECLIQYPNPNYRSVNLEIEQNDQFSTYNFMKSLLQIKKIYLSKPDEIGFTSVSDNVILMQKANKDNAYAIVNLNNISEKEKFYFTDSTTTFSLQILTATPNSSYKTGDVIRLPAELTLRPVSGIIVKLVG